MTRRGVFLLVLGAAAALTVAAVWNAFGSAQKPDSELVREVLDKAAWIELLPKSVDKPIRIEDKQVIQEIVTHLAALADSPARREWFSAADRSFLYQLRGVDAAGQGVWSAQVLSRSSGVVRVASDGHFSVESTSREPYAKLVEVLRGAAEGR